MRFGGAREWEKDSERGNKKVDGSEKRNVGGASERGRDAERGNERGGWEIERGTILRGLG